MVSLLVLIKNKRLLDLILKKKTRVVKQLKQYFQFSNPRMINKEALQNPRVIVVQKLYAYYLNKESEIIYPKHRYKKFIKDVVKGTIERTEIIQELIDTKLKENKP